MKRRILSIIMALALCVSACPTWALAEESVSSPCTHHRSHTPDCGYIEAEPGHECTHEHTEDCYRTAEGEDGNATKELDCHHEHDESCGYREEIEGNPCTFVCEICNEGTDGTPEDKTDDNEINDGESENSGTENGDEIEEPGDGQEECTCEELCTEGSINTDCPMCGAEDASLSDCKGKDAEDSTEDAEENTKQPEDAGLCKHHPEHDDTCGYQPESKDNEGSPCTYECRICPVEKLIAALPDAADITEDNASEVRAQLEEILALFAELTEEEQEQIDLSLCCELQAKLDAANVPAPAEEGTPDLELFGQKICSGDSGDGWSYTDGVLTLENYHSDNSGEVFIHITNADLEFTLYLKGDNSVKTSEKLIYGNAFGNTTITGDPGASLSLNGKSWADRYIFIRGVNVDVTTQDMIFLSYDMEIDNATVSFNMNGSNGYIYTTHGGFTIKNGSDVTITNSSGAVDYCVATNKAVITDSALKITNPSGFGVYVTKISTQVSEYKASVTNSTISAYVPDAGIHCEDELSVTSSQITNSGQFLLRSKKAVTVDGSSTMKGIIYEFFKSDTGAAYQVYGSHTLAANLTVAANDSFTIPEGAALTIPDGVTLENNGTMRIHEKDSLTGTGALTGNGKFLIDVNEDTISVPEGLVYTGKDYTDQIILEENAAVCGVEFIADTEGWTRNIEPTVVKDAGTYTVTFTKGDKEISRTFTVAQSGTQFAGEGVVKTCKDGAECSDFTADDTITVKATPTATGAAPVKAAARLRGVYAAPAAGQMAVFVGNNQVSDAVGADADGSYTMTVNASDVLEQGNVEPNGDPVTLIAKFVGNDNMVDAAGTVDVKISAVAKVVNGDTTTYVGNLDDAFKAENDGATITLLGDVMRTEYLIIGIDCTLDLGGHTIFGNLDVSDYILIIVGKNVTIQGDGGISGTGDAQVLQTSGNVIIKGGTFSCESGNCIFVTGSNASLSITGSEVRVENTGGYGLCIGNASSSVQLSAGTYSGEAGAIFINGNNSFTLGDLLGHTDTTRYAYFDSTGTTPFTGRLEGKSLAETVKVQECEHTGVGVCEYTHATGTTTHQQTCLACGDTKTSENCSFDENGKCPCGAVLAVTLPDNLNLTYTGTAQTPAVTVTVDGTELAANHYTATYANNTNAGTAMVIVTGKTYTGKVTKKFTIQQATPTLAWESTTQELTYTGNEARITAPKATGPNDIQLGITNDTGPCRFSYAAQGDSTFTDGLPIDAGTYTIKASVEAKGNYTAADSTNTLKLTINKAPGTLTVPEIQISRKYGDASFSLNCSTNGDGRISYKSSNEDVASVSADGMVLITGAGTAVITVSLGEGTNYSAAGNRTITVNVDKKDGYVVETLSRSYLYSRENTDSIDLATLLPKDCGAAAYGTPAVSGNLTYSTAPAVTDGKLSYTLGTGNNNDEGSITVTVSTRNYADITVTVKVKLTDRIPVGLKEGTEVTLAGNILTYGESLSKLEFNNAVFVDGNGNTVKGALTWKDAAARPTAGTTSAVWVFTPTDQAYLCVEGTAAITVNRAVPAVSAAPTVADRIYNPLRVLRKSDLSGGTAGGVDGMELAGEWNWQSADIVPAVNNSGYAAVFTPADITNYKPVTRTITVTVEKATPYIAVIPAAAGITYGETLKDSSLTGGAVQYGNGAGQAGNGAESTEAVAGTFAWKEPSEKPAVADSSMTEYAVIFTPSDTADYHPVETKVKLTVNKAQYAPNMPGSAMDVSNSMEKAGDVPLPEGWEWQASDKDTALVTGAAVNAVAVYTGADKGNYEKETVTVAITRSVFDHPSGPESGRPFLKGEDGRIGWDIIRAEEEQAQEGSTINVDMNGSTVVPGDIFDRLKGRDIIITFDMGNGILWSVNGKSITTDRAGDIDFSVQTGVNTVPVDIVNHVTGERYSIQISLAYEGEFGFTAVLSIGLGKENAGYRANLYYYNKSAGALEFICADEVSADGTVSLAFTHASDYVIVIDKDGKDGDKKKGSGGAESALPETPGGNSTVKAVKSPQTGEPWRPWWAVVTGILAIIVSADVYFTARKKKNKKNG